MSGTKVSHDTTGRMAPEDLNALHGELERLRDFADRLEKSSEPNELSEDARAARRDTWIAITALRDSALRIEEALQSIAMARSR